jgi:hypothetical protein
MKVYLYLLKGDYVCLCDHNFNAAYIHDACGLILAIHTLMLSHSFLELETKKDLKLKPPFGFSQTLLILTNCRMSITQTCHAAVLSNQRNIYYFKKEGKCIECSSLQLSL